MKHNKISRSIVMANQKLNIGIILGSTRKGRVSPQVGEYILEQARERNHNYELIDIKDYQLPLLGESDDQSGVEKWNSKLETLDAFVFIVCEYNHSMSAALKNALDSAREAWYHKAAGIVSYGSGGGIRAAEHLRGVLSELNIASVRSHVFFSLFDDFEKFSTFKPRDIHKDNLQTLFSQVETWGQALKTIR